MSLKKINPLKDVLKKLPNPPTQLINPKDQIDYDFAGLFEPALKQLSDFSVFSNPNLALFAPIYPQLKQLMDTAMICNAPEELGSLYYNYLWPMLKNFCVVALSKYKRSLPENIDLENLLKILKDDEVQAKIIKSILYIKENVLVLLFNELKYYIENGNQTKAVDQLGLILNRVAKYRYLDFNIY